MKDEEYADLKLRMMIIPEQAKWHEPRFTHWQKLHEAADEARQRVAKAFSAMDQIDHNSDLTPEGKAKECRKIAERGVAQAKASKTLESARAAVTRQMQTWANKLSEVIKPAEDVHTATLHSEIRNRVANMTKEDRLTFLQKNGGDPLIASALLLAPAFLSGLTEAEFTMVSGKVERGVISPKCPRPRPPQRGPWLTQSVVGGARSP